MTNFTTNFHPNPAFQNGLVGVAATTAETIVNLDVSNLLYGPASLLVTCPGNGSGEGVQTGHAVIPADCQGSASCFVNGTGNITAYVYADGQVVGVQHITLTESWNRVIIQDIAFVGGNEVYLQLEATKIEACQFWCSGFQVEPNQFAHPYCDGDQDGCFWESGFYGISYCLYENPITATAVQHTATNKVNILIVGEAFAALAETINQRTYNALVQVGAAGPLSAITDFGVSALTDPDPAQSYVTWNNAGTVNSTTYQQSWATWVPPRDYIVSDGSFMYRRAAFAALGWDYASAAINNYAQLTKVYAGIKPVQTTNTPPVFDNPRSVHSVIIADRINFVTNPSFEVSTANWSPIGSATLTRDGSVTVGEIALYDETILSAGSYSCNVTLNADFDGASITIPNLLPGYTYIASVYVKSGLGLNNIVMNIGGSATSIQSTGGTGYGFGAYNAGPYGGFNPTGDLPTDTWYRIWCIFTSSGDSEVLNITSSPAVDVTYPTHMWIDAVLVEQGEILQPYFDGSIGINYTWDSQTGTPGLARSYYYSQMQVKQQAVNNVLARHTPLGISYATPVYSVPPVE